LVSGFVPDEGFWVAVVVLDEAAYGSFQFSGRAMRSASELFVGQRGEPSFDQVQPTGRSRHEVQMEAQSFGQQLRINAIL
jgi:hypothetical protein